MKSQILSVTATALSLSSVVLAQTSTSCDPLTNTTCPSDPALGKTVTIDFTQGESSYFTADEGTTITYDKDNGATFTIDSSGLAQTLSTTDYIFFGKVSLTMKAANGTGIVSSFVMLSDDLDEIDIEWLGGNTTSVETNYFGKGNTTLYNRAIYYAVDKPQDDWHTYTVDWTSAYTHWYIDGALVRTLYYDDALDGKNYPQTPMQIKLGNWDGGAADEATGTVEWAGGYTDLADAPFIMYVKNITIEDYTTSGTEYTYGNESGDYDSIVISKGTANDTASGTSYTSNSTVGTNGSSAATVAATAAADASSSTSSTSSSTATSAGSIVGTSLLMGAMGCGLAFFL